MMHFFTSITTNYLPKARVLAHSLKQFNPDAVFHLVLSDRLPDSVSVESEPFDSVIYPQDLDIPNLESWIFKHTVVELCTAVKGAAFLKIFKEYNTDKVVYLDPDIAVFHALTDLENLLEEHSIILTPHLVNQETSAVAIVDNEICSLQHGIYNLGFLAVRRSKEGLVFLQWWRDRLIDYCYDDIPSGLFTDQRWIDLAPAMFEDVYILRDKAYNVAPWNISQRQVSKNENGDFLVEGKPVMFYHFSGFDSGACEGMLGRYGQGNDDLKSFFNWYLGAINKAGQAQLGTQPSIYATYSNGQIITKAQRVLYRERQDLQQTFLNPSQVTEDKWNYYDWYITEGATHIGVTEPKDIDKVKAILNRYPRVKKAAKAILKRLIK